MGLDDRLGALRAAVDERPEADAEERSVRCTAGLVGVVSVAAS
ncbi:MAG: hypothetical protein R2702_05510 [Acidimicrobiales bacterium]